MHEKDERLDIALSEYRGNKRVCSEELLPYQQALQRLEVLRDVPGRNPEVEAIARKTFIENAQSMPMPVSKDPNLRLKGWKTFFRRERSPMTKILGFVLALVVAFGGAGTTAYAAQDSLPNEPLYPVKQFTEQIRLALTTDTEAEVYLLLDLTKERVDEMMSLANQGLEVPEKTESRFQEHLKLALGKAAQLGDAAMMGILQRVQTMAQTQIQAMQQLQQKLPGDSPCEALQLAISAMNRVQREAEDGLEDPATFRLRQGTNRPEDAPDQPDKGPQGPKNDGKSLPDDDIPGQGYGNGTGDSGGANGDGYGDGTGDGGEVNGYGYGDGTGDGGGAHGNGFGDGTGDGGGAYGDGDGDGICDCNCEKLECDCTTECTPQGPENGQKGPKGGEGKD